MKVPRAIYTSGYDDYKLVVLAGEIEEYGDKIETACEAHNAYTGIPGVGLEDGEIGVLFYPLDDGKWCISVDIINGTDNVNRKRFFSHSVVLGDEEMKKIEYNPFLIVPKILEETKKMKKEMNFSNVTEYLYIDENELKRKNVYKLNKISEKDYIPLTHMLTRIYTDDIIIYQIEPNENQEHINSICRTIFYLIPDEKRKNISFSTHIPNPYQLRGFKMLFVSGKVPFTVPKGYFYVPKVFSPQQINVFAESLRMIYGKENRVLDVKNFIKILEKHSFTEKTAETDASQSRNIKISPRILKHIVPHPIWYLWFGMKKTTLIERIDSISFQGMTEEMKKYIKNKIEENPIYKLYMNDIYEIFAKEVNSEDTS